MARSKEWPTVLGGVRRGALRLGGKKRDGETVLDRIDDEMPWVHLGIDASTSKLWNKSRQAFIDAVDEA